MPRPINEHRLGSVIPPRVTKIAVPTKDGLVGEHFGYCREFSVFKVEGKSLVLEATIASGAVRVLGCAGHGEGLKCSH
jgi:predicted Fe-Mo cluster-binding NifX family protein